MDVVALAQLGFANAVATLGTACTPFHVRTLLRQTDRIVFSFDGDSAGQRAGLSRTSVYEYFGSGSELVADLVIDELGTFAATLNEAVSDCSDPQCIVTCWIKGALEYIADGRHLLAKALNATSMPQSRAQQIGMAHRVLMAPLVKAVEELGVKDTRRALSFIQAITDASTKRIESGHDAEGEIAYATSFCINGLIVN